MVTHKYKYVVYVEGWLCRFNERLWNMKKAGSEETSHHIWQLYFLTCPIINEWLMRSTYLADWLCGHLFWTLTESVDAGQNAC